MQLGKLQGWKGGKIMNGRGLTPISEDISQIKGIIRAVASIWGIESKIILGRTRRQPHAFARQVCMALAYQETSLSLNQVGECFDNRDHGTVIHAIKAVNEARKYPHIGPLIDQVMAKIKTEA